MGFRVASGDESASGSRGGSPLSNNPTFSSDGRKKPLYVDTAYGKWTAIKDDNLVAARTFGKMGNRFNVSPMVFDPDYTPEGGAIQATYKVDDQQSFRFNGAALCA